MEVFSSFLDRQAQRRCAAETSTSSKVGSSQQLSLGFIIVSRSAYFMSTLCLQAGCQHSEIELQKLLTLTLASVCLRSILLTLLIFLLSITERICTERLYFCLHAWPYLYLLSENLLKWWAFLLRRPSMVLSYGWLPSPHRLTSVCLLSCLLRLLSFLSGQFLCWLRVSCGCSGW